MKVLLPVFIFLIFFCLTNYSYAVTVEIADIPSSIQQEDEVDINVKIGGAKASTPNYIRGAFFQSGSTSYFGYTYNNENNWYNASPLDPKKFFQIQIDADGNWSGILKVKPDIQSTHFKGNGSYLFKVGRYTESATSVSDWSESKEIVLSGNQPTPTITPTPTKIPATPTPTKIPATPTPTKAILTPTKTIPTKTISSSPIPTKISVSAKYPYPSSSKESSSASSVNLENKSVLGSKDQKDPSVTPIVQGNKKEQINSSSHKLPMVGGVLFLCSACGILVYRKYKQEKELEI